MTLVEASAQLKRRISLDIYKITDPTEQELNFLSLIEDLKENSQIELTQIIRESNDAIYTVCGYLVEHVDQTTFEQIRNTIFLTPVELSNEMLLDEQGCLNRIWHAANNLRCLIKK